MVQAAVLPAIGSPLVVEELTLAAPGRGEVRLDLAYAGVCHSDLSVIDGVRPRPVPMALGHEASGVVAEIGPGVTDLAPGDHVICTFVPACGACPPCVNGRPALCEPGAAANTAGTLLRGARPFRRADGSEVHQHLGVSAFARQTVVSRESLVQVDKDLPLDVAVLFGCGVLTGAGAVLNAAPVRPGSSVAVLGLGGVGLSALLAAVAAGAYPVLAVDVREDKLELARSLGAHHTRRADVDSGERYETVIECAGNERVLAQAYAMTARGGTTVTVGLPHPDRQLSIPAVSLVAEERTLRGSYLGSAVPARDIPRLIGLYRAGLLPVDRLVSRVYPLAGINDAFDALRAGEVARALINLEDQ
ncbi:alcohol dehydrogenase catalytic domain-containing protein [Actinoplanes bogorensis]|uniref:Alcohol dehydrogenase catalytic domain-containing protein n=1 Tax=Paractinoplanes bogorensis TaxID=1610840 RepID=A0ABS5YXI7_9ACTN|nr:alcohol dehydrogenase catalytic domain-containing protein [Actinoplanes bogorensis]MBU2668162.1 alcohol dehydrogenase catalytic domain-containing protein [Actinoplanes bogorensis]